jgi:membrane AbrB-like protein
MPDAALKRVLSAPPALAPTVVLRRLAETLALAAVGGALFTALGVPAGWLSGAILTVGAAALAGRPMLIPGWLLRILFIVVGISLGAVATPETLRGIATYPGSVAVLILAMVCVSLAGTAYLRTVHGWQPLTAFLASAPGAMSQVLVAAAELGADLRAVAIVQSLRVVVVAVFYPAGMFIFGLASDALPRAAAPLTWAFADELLILAVASTFGAFVFQRLRLPGGMLFGALIASAALHGSGLIEAAVPAWAADAAMVALGGVIGARFANTSLTLLSRYILAAFAATAVTLAIAGLFTGAVIAVYARPVVDVTLALAPGSVEVMMLLAIALALDPVYVGAHHMARILFVAFLTPIVARRIAGAARRGPPGSGAAPPD